ncbi:MAG: hypothetical protein ABGY96_16105 [bacterium]|nr:hypothetical protein [Gammaproteobacteria bacterium]
MKDFDGARQFFEACEAPLGWEGCREFVCDNASFVAQSEPLASMKTIQEYCDWMYGFGTVTAAGATYDLHTSSYDESTRTAVFFATYHARHTGEGGPVAPTNKETHSHYVYVLTMDGDGKVEKMTKIWNAPWALNELGWT